MRLEYSFFQQVRCMPRRDLLDDPSCHRFVGNFALGPLGRWGCLWVCSDAIVINWERLFSGDLASGARSRQITEPVSHDRIC